MFDSKTIKTVALLAGSCSVDLREDGSVMIRIMMREEFNEAFGRLLMSSNGNKIRIGVNPFQKHYFEIYTPNKVDFPDEYGPEDPFYEYYK